MNYFIIFDNNNDVICCISDQIISSGSFKLVNQFINISETKITLELNLRILQAIQSDSVVQRLEKIG